MFRVNTTNVGKTNQLAMAGLIALSVVTLGVTGREVKSYQQITQSTNKAPAPNGTVRPR